MSLPDTTEPLTGQITADRVDGAGAGSELFQESPLE